MGKMVSVVVDDDGKNDDDGDGDGGGGDDDDDYDDLNGNGGNDCLHAFELVLLTDHLHLLAHHCRCPQFL